MKVLMIGDVFGRIGRDMLFEYAERGFFGADFVIANIENAAHGRGVTKQVFDELKRLPIDVFTLGNHIWDCPDIQNILKYNDNVIRPDNLEGELPGSGYTITKTKDGVKIGVINLLGRVNVTPYSKNPFLHADSVIDRIKDKCDLIFVDFHAEATSEKLAMGYHLDGKVTAVSGTHTHVQTADETILPGGTGYITDLGMTGPAVSVLGMDKNIIVNNFKGEIPKRYEPANGKGQFNAVLFDIDMDTKKTASIERINIR